MTEAPSPSGEDSSSEDAHPENAPLGDAPPENASQEGVGGTNDPARSRSVVVGAVKYAVVEGESRLFRSYAAIGSVLALFVALTFVLALPVWVVEIGESGGGPLQRIGLGLLWLVGLVAIATLVVPMLFVVRRHREGRPERQFAFGLAGYAYVLTAYLALVVSAPADLRDSPEGPIAPVLEVLYALPRLSALAFPVVGTLLVLAVEYGLDRDDRDRADRAD
jgi:hypothetical protein